MPAVDLTSASDSVENGFVDENVVKQLKGDQERFKFLCRKFFTDDEP